ncbi:hypothetical protein [Amycolatopsis saalfeldensis]|uniref:hypothetical protein n=1 Tax=Amycolatopsis saalfeldensis TaxID=394193 RepID=UPI001FEBDA07|nr:hypothetical protein [Amycolatopsis saalfeldensis]
MLALKPVQLLLHTGLDDFLPSHATRRRSLRPATSRNTPVLSTHQPNGQTPGRIHGSGFGLRSTRDPSPGHVNLSGLGARRISNGDPSLTLIDSGSPSPRRLGTRGPSLGLVGIPGLRIRHLKIGDLGIRHLSIRHLGIGDLVVRRISIRHLGIRGFVIRRLGIRGFVIRYIRIRRLEIGDLGIRRISIRHLGICGFVIRRLGIRSFVIRHLGVYRFGVGGITLGIRDFGIRDFGIHGPARHLGLDRIHLRDLGRRSVQGSRRGWDFSLRGISLRQRLAVQGFPAQRAGSPGDVPDPAWRPHVPNPSSDHPMVVRCSPSSCEDSVLSLARGHPYGNPRRQ